MALTYDGLFRQQQALMERQRTFPLVCVGDEPPEARAAAYRLYWAAETAMEEREAYRKILALGGEPAYCESPTEVAVFVGAAGVIDEAAVPDLLPPRVLTVQDNTYVRSPANPDLLSITRDIARGG